MNNWLFINDGGNKNWIEKTTYQIGSASEISLVPVYLQDNLVSFYWIIKFYAYIKKYMLHCRLTLK